MKMSPQRPLGIILFAWLLLLPLAAGAGDDLRTRLEQLRGQSRPTVMGAPLVSAQLLDDFYRRRNDRYVWRDNRRVEDLLRLAEQSVAEGFRPSDFHVRRIRDMTTGWAFWKLFTSDRVDEEILLSDSLLRLIHHRRYGEIDPQRLDRGLMRDLERAVMARDLQAEVAGLTSSGPVFYTRLQRGLARYRRIAAVGGWPRLPAGKPLRPYTYNFRVPVMRKRLQATGDFKGSASASRLYDAALATAVRAFQKRHQLRADGVVGSTTRVAMNISVATRLNQIHLNLARMRRISNRLPDDFLLVDIAAQRVELFRNGRAIWGSRVIVGRPKRPTPVFRDRVEYLEINPKWTVPPTILKKDILPAVRKNPGYLKRRGLQVVTRDGKPVSPQSVNWHASSKNFPYLIRQPPGARNALGRIKFMFPNRHSVYLHDTPSRSLFARSRRLFSSGCVRVEHPWKLAELILDNPRHWNRARLKRIVATGRTRQIRLDKPLTIILVYWTAIGDRDGKVSFRKDIYARDAAVLRKTLNRGGQLRIMHSQPVRSEAAVSAPLSSNGKPPGFAGETVTV